MNEIENIKEYAANKICHLACKSVWDIEYEGILHSDISIYNGPTFSIFNKIEEKIIVIFKSNINFHSHECLMFKELMIPFIYDIGNDIDHFIGKQIKISIHNNQGFISNCNEINQVYNVSYPIKSFNALNSNLKGMKYLKQMGVKKIVVRGEFLYSNKISQRIILNQIQIPDLIVNEIISTLLYGVNNFDELIFRFSDFSLEYVQGIDEIMDNSFYKINSFLGVRGIQRLLNDCRHLLNFEVNIIKMIHKKNPNISVLIPYVRSAQEALESLSFIKGKFKGKIGCMIEVPLMIYESILYSTFFDFFVVGTSDLYQLLQGSDRNIFELSNTNNNFASELILYYLIPNLRNDQILYITSSDLYLLLISKNLSCQIELLAK